ncbi:uncharacterized protein K452DRAFT_238716 [Aplosporella prunicola CBS 121167]|uniref:Uncharacterized protein n=1 Tax=Aplosporella prunicola CBS 121167 TaxID=1176127 RepID=A0A6A6AV16_9PEZI|nr:uncharacterized protein K452DRAFT_238716 [Aplosporella prunicola CBS 121167]KAF2135779.1 hypothetical protein K452DRAFT_238716 [Aplosporella prunicola CBS 121167]
MVNFLLLSGGILILPYVYLNSLKKPHPNIDLPLQSCLSELTDILSSLDYMLPKLSQFIDQFHVVVQTHEINVITDSAGNMSIDVPGNMPSVVEKEITKKIQIMDKLIKSQGFEINNLFQKAHSIENNIKLVKPEYNSKIIEQLSAFNKLNASYKH